MRICRVRQSVVSRCKKETSAERLGIKTKGNFNDHVHCRHAFDDFTVTNDFCIAHIDL